MHYLIDLDPEHRVLRATLTTRVLTEKRLTDVYRLLERTASQGGPYSAIMDLSKVKRSPVATEIVRNLAASNPAVPAGTPRVIVVKKGVGYGLARLFQLSRDSMDGQLHVVHSLDEAYALLGVKPEDFSQRLFPARSAA
jgi:hypothetical protein